MQTLKLANGNLMPVLGLGTWEADAGQVGEAIKYAILEVGYRHIDCAMIYGNEKEIGEALSEVFRNGVKREEIFITSKLWNTHHRPKNVAAGIQATLEDLQLDYLDLYLVHWGLAFPLEAYPSKKDERGIVIRDNVALKDTWQAMEAMHSQGLTKSLGVANYTSAMLYDLLCYASIQPMVNQVEVHPYLNQKELIEYCRKEKIVVTAYSPLGSPGTASEFEPRVLEEKKIKEIADKHEKTSAQVLIRWAIQRGTVTIPKSTKKERIKENFEVFDFELTAKEIDDINALNRNHRYVAPINWWGMPYFS